MTQHHLNNDQQFAKRVFDLAKAFGCSLVDVDTPMSDDFNSRFGRLYKLVLPSNESLDLGLNLEQAFALMMLCQEPNWFLDLVRGAAKIGVAHHGPRSLEKLRAKFCVPDKP